MPNGMSCCSGRVPDPRQAKAKHRPENQTMKRRLQSRKLRRHEAARPAPRVTELIERETLGYHHDPGWRNNMPIVIVPGFCSSGLKVTESFPCPEWENERVWFSLQKLSVRKRGRRVRHSSAHSAALLGENAASGAAPEAEGGAAVASTTSQIMRSRRRVSSEFAKRGYLHKQSPSGTGWQKRWFVLDVKSQQLDYYGSRKEARKGISHRKGTIRLANILDVKRSVSTASAFTIYHSLPDREPYSLRAGGPAGSRAWIRKLHTHAPLLSESRQEEWSIGIGGANHLESRTSPDHHPNAYAIIWWDDEFVGKSEIRICTRHPVWNCKLYYAPPVKATGTIHIAVFNSSDGRTVTEHDEMLGEATIVVDDKSSEPAESCHDITLSGDMTGTVTIGVQKLSGDESDDDEDDDMDDSDEEFFDLNVDLSTQVDASMWIKHMGLVNGHEDPEGIKVRALKGISGVDYLQPGAITTATTWVFGKVINHLKKCGYSHTNMKAAPYDWRIPPRFLETRDGYMSSLCNTIEHTYESNGGRPVVLLAHSMGCRTAHYFLCWVKNQKDIGDLNSQLWIDKYIHSLFAAGGPFLGSPGAHYAALTGLYLTKDCGLGAFLNADESMALSRAIGSAPFLMPQMPGNYPIGAGVRAPGALLAREMPIAGYNDGGTTAVTAGNYYPVYTRAAGVFTIEIKKVLLESDVALGLKYKEVYVEIEHTKTKHGRKRCEVMHTLVLALGSDHSCSFNQRFQIVSEHESLENCVEETIVIRLRRQSELKAIKRDVSSALGRISGEPKKLVRSGTSTGIFAGATSPYVGSVPVMSPNELFGDQSQVDTPRSPVPEPEPAARPEVNSAVTKLLTLMEDEQTEAGRRIVGTVEIEMTSVIGDARSQMSGLSRDHSGRKLGLFARGTAHKPNMLQGVDAGARHDYQAAEMKGLLRTNGAGEVVDWWRDFYNEDENFGKDDTVFKAPPCRRLYHVHGTHMQTALSYVYKYKNGVEVSSEGPRSLGVTLDERATNLDSNVKCSGGIIYETGETLQYPPHTPDKAQRISGDGTCPYASLNWSRTWNSETFLSQTCEIPGLEHRAMLGAKQFYNIMMEYLAETIVVYVLEARYVNVKSFGGVGGTMKPYCTVNLRYISGKRTKAHKTRAQARSSNPQFMEVFTFGATEDLRDAVGIEVELKDAIGNEKIGSVWVPLDDVERSPTRAINDWFRVCTGKSTTEAVVSTGSVPEVRLHVEYETGGQSFRGVPDAAKVAASIAPSSLQDCIHDDDGGDGETRASQSERHRARPQHKRHSGPNNSTSSSSSSSSSSEDDDDDVGRASAAIPAFRLHGGEGSPLSRQRSTTL